jgi:formylglycine-generating enzyme required for sulfatase activity
MGGPDAVDAHPQGASSFGVMEMVGDAWQWIDEFVVVTGARRRDASSRWPHAPECGSARDSGPDIPEKG